MQHLCSKGIIGLMTETRNILALDPARRTGFCHSNGVSGFWFLGEGPALFVNLYRRLHAAQIDWGVDEIAAEEAAYGSHNQQTKSWHSELLGVVKLVAAQLDVPVRIYNPGEIKMFAVGKWMASKWWLMWEWHQRFGVWPRSFDECDAMWCHEAAKCGFVHTPQPKRKKKRKAKKTVLVKAKRLF